MKILFACGGSAGHINPAIAIANTIKRDYPDAEFLFAGNPNRMEAELVPKAGFAFAPILVEGFQRKINWANIKHNVRSVFYFLNAGKQAKRIITEFQPDAVVGTGGYVSAPILQKAAKLGYPTITHESNAFPGVTTKFLCRYVDKVLLAVEELKPLLPTGSQMIVTGNPVRTELLKVDSVKARESLGVGDRICILSMGGSNGAEWINHSVASVIAAMQPIKKTHHIHATGRFGVESMPKRLKELRVDLSDEHLDIREYIYNMEECLAAADLVICRAGAITLNELKTVGKASILIPSPNVAENHQYYNAMELANKNAAIVIEEKDLTEEKLSQIVADLVADPQELRNLSQNAKRLAVLDGAERICSEIYDSIKNKK